jgi:septal ring factor EnvC (AmiA/AmiB activator)
MTTALMIQATMLMVMKYAHMMTTARQFPTPIRLIQINESDHEKGQLIVDLAQAQAELAQAQAELSQAQSDFNQCSTSLYQCNSDLSQSEADVAQCTAYLIQYVFYK